MGEGGGAQGVEGSGRNRETSAAETGGCGLQQQAQGVVGGTESLEGDLHTELLVSRHCEYLPSVSSSVCGCSQWKQFEKSVVMREGLRQDGVVSPSICPSSALLCPSPPSSPLLGVVSFSPDSNTFSIITSL